MRYFEVEDFYHNVNMFLRILISKRRIIRKKMWIDICEYYVKDLLTRFEMELDLYLHLCFDLLFCLTEIKWFKLICPNENIGLLEASLEKL